MSSGCASSRYSTCQLLPAGDEESVGWCIRMFVVLYNEYILSWDSMVQILRIYSIAKLSGFKSGLCSLSV